MKKKDAQKNINVLAIVGVVIFIITSTIAIVSIYRPYLNRHKMLRTQILEERDRNILLGKIRALSKYVKAYSDKLPRGKGVSWLVSEVSDMATKEKIEVLSIKPESPEDNTLYLRLSVVMDFACNYHQLGRFLSRLESSPQFLKVESLNIKRLDTEEGFKEEGSRFKSFDIKGQTRISTFVLKE